MLMHALGTPEAARRDPLDIGMPYISLGSRSCMRN
jgi:hypothetical protein